MSHGPFAFFDVDGTLLWWIDLFRSNDGQWGGSVATDLLDGVFVVGRSLEHLEESVRAIEKTGRRAWALQADLSDAAQIEAELASYPAMDTWGEHVEENERELHGGLLGPPGTGGCRSPVGWGVLPSSRGRDGGLSPGACGPSESPNRSPGVRVIALASESIRAEI